MGLDKLSFRTSRLAVLSLLDVFCLPVFHTRSRNKRSSFEE